MKVVWLIVWLTMVLLFSFGVMLDQVELQVFSLVGFLSLTVTMVALHVDIKREARERLQGREAWKLSLPPGSMKAASIALRCDSHNILLMLIYNEDDHVVITVHGRDEDLTQLLKSFPDVKREKMS